MAAGNRVISTRIDGLSDATVETSKNIG